MSDVPFAPLDRTTWSETQINFIGPVFHGLLDGDLQPFADYLRAGLYVFPSMANAIADAIEGKDVPFRIITKGAKPSQQKRSVEAAATFRRFEIGVFFEDCCRKLGNGGFEAALSATCERYGVSPTSAKNHRKSLWDHIGDPSTVASHATFETLRQTYLGERLRQSMPMNQQPPIND